MQISIIEEHQPHEVRTAVIKLYEYHDAQTQLKDANLVFIELDLNSVAKMVEAEKIAQRAKSIGAFTIGVAPVSSLSEELYKFNDEFNSIIFAPINAFSDAVNTILGVLSTNGENDINLELDDIKTVFTKKSICVMGIGKHEGENAVLEAMRAALNSTLLDNISVIEATGVIAHFYINPNLSMMSIAESMALFQESVHEDADIIFGTTTDESLPIDFVRITIICVVSATTSMKTVNNVL